MRALVIEHDPYSTAGALGSLLIERGVALESLVLVEDMENPVSHVPFPHPTDHDLIVVMGSPWSVYEDAISTWIGRELDYLREAVTSDVPILAVCFGGQALSAALGGQVSPAPKPEYGWSYVDVTDANGSIASGPWFQFHKDAFTLPEGARQLAHNDAGLQAFRIGRSLGIQWHPEVNEPHLRMWYDAGGDGELEKAGIDPSAVMEETARLSVASAPNVEKLVDYFLADVAGL